MGLCLGKVYAIRGKDLNLVAMAQIAVGSLALVAAAAPTCLQAGPVWHSRLNGNAVAAVGADGVPKGAPVPADDRSGVPEAAVSFDGQDDFYTIGHLGSFPEGSMSAWVRLASADDNQGVAAAGERGGGAHVYFSLQTDVSGGVTYWRCDLDDGLSRRDVLSDSAVALNTWLHLAVTFTGNGALRMYVNGIEQADVQSLAGDNDPYAMTATGVIGTVVGEARALEGRLDDVSIWKERLPAKHIALIHGLGRFHGLDLDAPEIDAALALTTVGQTVSVHSTVWRYAAGLPGPTGTTGGTLAGQDAFIVLDSATGEGLEIRTGPVTPPAVVNLPASNVTHFSADVGGAVTDAGNESPQVTLYYGTIDGGTNPAAWMFGVALGTQSGTFSSSLDTLSFGTEYFYRCKAANRAGTVWAPDIASFRTTALIPPQLGPVTVADIRGFSADVTGTVADSGGQDPQVVLYYGTTDGGTNPTAWASLIDLGGQTGAFSTTLVGLQPETTHYVAIRAENPAGSTWTIPAVSFVTLDQSHIWINEFMAANVSTVVSNAVAGRFDDWIELHNASRFPFDLGGWHLTDDSARPAQWTFPAGTVVEAGGYIVVFASGDGTPDAKGNLHTSFKLDADGEYVGLFSPDLVAASEFGPAGTEYPDQDPDVSYGRSPLDQRSVFFERSTPGSPNDPGGFQPVADTRFWPDRGFYDHTISVVVTSATAGAQIFYTTDGTPPTTNSARYTGPIAITQTTVVRARGYKPGLRETDVDTHTYILMDTNAVDPNDLNQVLTQTQPPGYPALLKPPGGPAGDYDMDTNITRSAAYEQRLLAGLQDIPTLSLALPQDGFFGPVNGIYTHPDKRGIAWERDCSAELIAPGEDSDVWQVDCGIRVQGGASRNNVLKHSLSLRFRETYGPTKLRKRVFPEGPVNEFNVIALRAIYNNSWIHWDSGQRNRGSMIRDQWVRDSMLEMGNPAAGRGFFVHLYVNGLYWGVHNLAERQDAAHYASYNGGNDETLFARNGAEWIDGDPTAANAAWNAMKTVAVNGDWQAIQQVLDIDNYIDYQIIHRYGANGDLKTGGNWRAAGGGPDQLPWQIYSWDSERVLESPTATTKPLDPVGIRDSLEGQQEYRLRFADRLHRHFFNGGALTAQRCAERWMRRATDLDRAVIGESARWGDYRRTTPYTRDAEWISEQQRLLTTYFPARSQFVLDRYRADNLYPSLAAPSFSPHGGRMVANDAVVLTPSTVGMVYTLDGSDPRLQGGQVNPAALTSADAVTLHLTYTTIVKARSYDGVTWSALNEAVYLFPARDLRISEVMYHPDDETTEFVEIMNAGTGTVSLYGVRFAGSVDFDFTGSELPLLAPGSRVVVVRDMTAFTNRYGGTVPIAGTYGGVLDDDGEAVKIVDAHGTSIVSFAFNDGPGWPLCADGAGHSLVPLDDQAEQLNESLSHGAHWRASAFIGGSPGLPDPAAIRDVVVNEIQAHTDYPAPWFSNDSLELYNTAASAVSLEDWYLSDDVAILTKWPIPAGTTLGAREWIVFDEVHHFNNPPGAGFGLSKGGETVFLSRLAGDRLDRVVDGVRYAGLENSVSWGRYPDGSGHWYAMPRTLGRANVLTNRYDLRMTEVMYHPTPTPLRPEDNTFHEYIEISNPTADAIPLSNAVGAWRLSGGVTFTFPAGAWLASGEEALVVSFDPSVASNRLEFLSAYGIAGRNVQVFGPYARKLSNRGDRLTLERPLAPDTPEDPVSWVTVDEVIYFDQGDWPTPPDGSGPSLTRVSVIMDGRSSANWVSAPPTPGETLPVPAPYITAIPTIGALTLKWNGASSIVYSVEHVDTLRDTNWQSLTTIPGGSPALFSIPHSTNRYQSFYRLRVLP